jgi:hypothetical protein
MRKGYLIISFTVMALVCLTLSPALAQAPNSIVYQGRLVDGSGEIIGTPTSVVFRIYNVDEGGSHLYQQTKTVTPDPATGVFTTQLTLMSKSYFDDGTPRYLELIIGGETLGDRQLITSVPYAFSAEYAENVPSNSIYDTDIVDEPGVASAYNNATVTLTGGIQTVISRSIVIPTSGYVLVTAHCSAKMSHSNGTYSGATIGISDISSGFPPAQDVDFYLSSTVGTGSYNFPAGFTALFAEASAGTKTYYLLANESSGDIELADIQFNLLFVPTAYGTVSSNKSAADTGDMPLDDDVE